MRRLVCGVLVGLVGFLSLEAKVHTNKTFLMPRSHNENLAMEYTGWHKQFRKVDPRKWDGTVQIRGFYQESTNKKDLGKYFGKYNSATGPHITNAGSTPNIYAGEIQDFIWVADNRDWNSVAPVNNDRAFLLAPQWIISDPTSKVTDRLDVKGYMRPQQTSYGVTFDWHQKLDKITKGLYFKVNVPVVHVENDLRMCYTGARLIQDLPNGETASLADYLSGCLQMTGTYAQAPLTHAKICGDDDKTGVADVKVTLGYNFLYEEHKHLGVNVALTIPTNGKPKGERLFEATLGYAGHWALGMGVDCAFELWQQGNKSVEFVGAVNYNYLFNAREKRTIGFKYPDSLASDAYLIAGKRVPMGHYFLGGQQGEVGVFPLANVLTRDVGVEPGSRVEALVDFAFNWGGFTLDLGYNLFAKEAESVTVKCWTDNTYAIAAWTYDPNSGGTPTNFDITTHAWNSVAIQKADLLPQDAATPVYVTHKALIGATYAFDWKYPMMLGLGGSWEWVQGSNSALDGWALWLKAGVSF